MIVMKFVGVIFMTNASISMYDKSMLKYKRHEKIKRKKKRNRGNKGMHGMWFLA
jgi:hypothetical protein